MKEFYYNLIVSTCVSGDFTLEEKLNILEEIKEILLTL